jgi:hypothetical protein
MTGARIITDQERASLRRHASAAMKGAGASAREFADLTGWDSGTMSRCLNITNPACAHHFLPVDRAVEFDRWLGRPVILTAMARLLDCAVFPLPAVDPSGAGAASVAAAVKEFGDALSKIGVELGDDGRIDASDDLDGLIDEVSEALESGAALLERLRALRDGAGEGAR